MQKTPSSNTSKQTPSKQAKIPFGSYRPSPQNAEQPPAPYIEPDREVLGMHQVFITLLELTHLGNIRIHSRAKFPGKFLPHLHEFVERTASSTRIFQAHDHLREAFKDAKARGSHLATKQDWGQAIKGFTHEISLRMHQAPTVPITAENFVDVKIVMAP
jgi:hypothetical protein